MQHLIDKLYFTMLLIRTEFSNEQPVVRRIIQANRSAINLLGFAEEELIDQSIDMIIPQKDLDLWQTALVKINGQEVDNCIEAEIINKQRQSIQVLLSFSPLPRQNAAYSDCICLIQTLKADSDLLMMRRVFEQSDSAMMITDCSGQIEYINPKFTELTGYAPDELIGRHPNMLRSDHFLTQQSQAIWEKLANTGNWQGEVQNKHKNGHDYWVYASINTLNNSAGDSCHFLAIEEDITHSKAVESALIESEERFRQMAELSGEWLWEQDPNGYYLYSSIAVKQILGFSQEQIIGKHYTELLTAQDKVTQTALSASHHAFNALINHYQHKDGHEVLTESNGLPIMDAQGNLLKWRGIDRDITARITFQDELINSEKRTRLIIESSINAIVIMDSYGIITDWNRRAENMFGWSTDEAIGQRLDELIVPQRFHKTHRQGLQTYLQTGEGPILNRQTEQIAVRRDGTEFPVELSVSPLKIGNAYIFSGFIHDISGRRAAEQQIRQAQVNLAIAQNEIRIAQQIQATLSPALPIKTDQFEITGFCLPADKVGGDYYDYFFRNETHLDIVIADVSGHSIGPGLFMVETRSALRVQNDPSVTPAETLSVLNNFLFKDLDNSDFFITLFYLQVDLVKQQFSFANAGHPPPLLFNRIKGEFQELDADGLILGIKQQVFFEEKTLKLAEGDIILFYTDGLIEAESLNKEFFGLERVKAIFNENANQTPQAIIQVLLNALQQFCQTTGFSDDITLMVFKWE